MEEHRNKVVNLHAIQSQNIGKCTSKTNQELTNISKFTSDFTSKTDQIGHF